MRRRLFVLAVLLGVCWAVPWAQEGRRLVGVTWGSSELISFDPHSGTRLAKHLQLNYREAFRGLAFDERHRRLYALTQTTHNLYYIDVETLDISHVGNLRIDMREQPALDTGPLAYDPITDTLYAVIEYWDRHDLHLWSELYEVDPQDGSLAFISRIDGPFIDSLAFSKADRQLYGLAIHGSGPWDSSFKAELVRIDPSTGYVETLFQTPYHTMLGLALYEPFTFLSWVNWTSHFYSEMDLRTGIVQQLGDADATDVISAMVSGDFSLGSRPLPEDPVTFVFGGRVTSVLDPSNVLRGRVRKGYRISGRLSYDIVAPYKHPDPNPCALYGMSVRTGGIGFSASDLQISVVNNYYDGWDQSVSDSLELRANGEGGATISWSLRDSSARALSGNDTLPDHFNLSEWEQNSFVIKGQLGSGPPKAAHYSIAGTIQYIRRIQARSNPGSDECELSLLMQRHASPERVWSGAENRAMLSGIRMSRSR